MEISFRQIDNHKVMVVNGEVDLYNVSELKKALFDAIDDTVTSLIVDMRDIFYMDSSGIGALVAGQKKMKAKNGKFGLLNIHEDVMNVLKLATLDKFFTIYGSEADIAK